VTLSTLFGGKGKKGKGEQTAVLPGKEKSGAWLRKGGEEAMRLDCKGGKMSSYYLMTVRGEDGRARTVFQEVVAGFYLEKKVKDSGKGKGVLEEGKKRGLGFSKRRLLLRKKGSYFFARRVGAALNDVGGGGGRGGLLHFLGKRVRGIVEGRGPLSRREGEGGGPSVGESKGEGPQVIFSGQENTNATRGRRKELH